MKPLYKHIPCIILIIFTINACKDRDEFRVDSEFSEYLTLFKAEGAKRNQYFNFEQTGLIIEFADLKNNKAGLCHYENPIRIEIDKEYWHNIANFPHGHLMRENLIFHELGHGILNRDHLNELLPNGDWKSIMCGGEKVNSKSWNINYSEDRRTYYIDELFLKNVPVPDFACMTFSADTLAFKTAFFLSFDTENKSDAGWSMTDISSHKISIENKKLRFDSRSETAFFVLGRTGIDVLTDFIFEAHIECQSNNTDAQCGIIFGSNDNGLESLEYFSFNSKASIFTGNKSMYSFRTELQPSNIIQNGTQKLKIVKLAGLMYFFVNDQYIYNCRHESTVSGNSFGFIVPSKATVWVDNLRVAVKKSKSQSQKLSLLYEKEFTVVETENTIKEVYSK